MEHNYLQEFMETCHAKERKWFLEQTFQYLNEHRQELADQVKKNLEIFLRGVVIGQNEFPVPVECIQISLLDVSIFKEEPALRYDAYGEMGVLGTRLFGKNFPCQWILTYWDEYRKRLENDVKKMQVSRYISQARIQQIMMESTGMLNALIYGIIKYSFDTLNTMEPLKELLKTDYFYISFGNYMDRQKLIYAEYPEIDIFFNTEGESLEYRKYQHKVYRKKEFMELNLTHSQFVECQFVNCKFEKCDLKDVTFENCRFYHTDMEKCIGFGMNINNCILEELKCVDGVFHFLGEKVGRLKDIYKPLEIFQSQIDYMEVENCNLSYSNLFDNYGVKIKVSECNLENSVMEGKIDENGIFEVMPEQEDE